MRTRSRLVALVVAVCMLAHAPLAIADCYSNAAQEYNNCMNGQLDMAKNWGTLAVGANLIPSLGGFVGSVAITAVAAYSISAGIQNCKDDWTDAYIECLIEDMLRDLEDQWWMWEWNWETGSVSFSFNQPGWTFDWSAWGDGGLDQTLP